jgi:hypothetical protein
VRQRQPDKKKQGVVPSINTMGSRAQAAYVEDVDGSASEEEIRTVEGSRRSATSTTTPNAEVQVQKSSRKEHRSHRPRKSRSDSGYDSLLVPHDAGESTTIREVRVIPDEDARQGRRTSLSASTKHSKSPRKQSRPGVSRNVTFEAQSEASTSKPKAHKQRDKDDPKYFGISGNEEVVTQPAVAKQHTHRPSLTLPERPRSYMAPTIIPGPPPSRPPLSHSAFSHGYAAPVQPVMMNTHQIPILQPHYPVNPPMFAAQPGSPSRSGLANRFARTGIDAAHMRPASSAAVRHREDPQYYSDDFDEYESAQESFEPEPVTRKHVLSSRRQSLKGPRTSSDLLPSVPQAPPENRRRSIRQSAEVPQFDRRDDFDDNHDRPPRRPQITYRETAPPKGPGGMGPPPRPRPKHRADSSFDYGDIRIETTAQNGRRNSYYGGGTQSSAQSGTSNYEELARQAKNYQNQVSGEPPQLTAEMLRRQQRAVAPSRGSTRSSGSRDDSDLRRSATTRTTRSGSEVNVQDDGDGVTLRLKGEATVKFQGAEIQSRDGLELTFNNNNKENRRLSLRNGSEASRSDYAPSEVPTASDEREERMRRLERMERRAIEHRIGGSRRRSSSSHPPGGWV